MGSDLERQAAEQQRRNLEALEAQAAPESRERFLEYHRLHILRITAKVLNAPVSYSDEAWSVAFRAVNEALDSYDEGKGNFWTYAVLVVRSRLRDDARRQARLSPEMSVRPEVFEGRVKEEDPDYGTQKLVQEKVSFSPENRLREEIDALQKELSGYDISFFDLAACSPHSQKTRQACARLIKALFTPPPSLMPGLRMSHTLPAKEMLLRSGEKKKTVERYRKYLICSGLILDGDYPGLADYLQYIRKEIQNEGRDGK